MNNITQEIGINFYEDEYNTLLLRIFDDNTSFLLFDEFPPNNNKLTDYQLDNLDEILSKISGVKVIHDDRELFIIYSNEKIVLNKIILFFENL